MRNSTGFSLWILLAVLLLALSAACPPPSGELPSNDDDASDDDDGADDDDTSDDDDDDDDDDSKPPEGIPLSGVVRHAATSGSVPAGVTNVGMFVLSLDGFSFADERFSTVVSEKGLVGGDTVYTLYAEGEPESADFTALDEDGTEIALFGVFTYVDLDGSGAWNSGDHLLGSSETFFLYARYSADLLPDILEDMGADAGWNMVEYSDLLSGEISGVVHVPDGTNSNNGPLISVGLLSRTSGSAPLTTSVAIPEGSVVSGLHVSAQSSGPQDSLLVMTQAVSAAEPGSLGAWTISGEPPADHLGDLEGIPADTGDDDDSAASEGPDWFPRGAAYTATVWFDEGADQSLTTGPCDMVLAAGANRLLLWLDDGEVDLNSGFQLQRAEVPLGWMLYDLNLETWRPLSLGLTVDDSDPSTELPPECIPAPGDDDDSAGPGDDDDSGK